MDKRYKGDRGPDKQYRESTLQRLCREADSREGAGNNKIEKRRNVINNIYPELEKAIEVFEEIKRNTGSIGHSRQSMRYGYHVSNRHRGEGGVEMSAHYIDRIIDEVCMPFLVEYDRKTSSILRGLPGGLGHLEERELRWDPQVIAQMERRYGITDYPASGKIDSMERIRSDLIQEYYGERTTYERQGMITSTLGFIENHLTYLKSLPEQYSELGIKVAKYKRQRNKLSNMENLSHLRSKLVEQHQRYLAFINGNLLSQLSRENNAMIVDMAIKRYEAKRDPNVISPLVLSRENRLVERASKTVLDEQIARIQERRKRIAEDLGLESYDDNDPFFLRSQKHKTKYYEDRPDLTLIQQGGRMSCGITCTQMVAADKNKNYSVNGEAILQQFEHRYPQLPVARGSIQTFPSMYPAVLLDISHPVLYDYVGNSDVAYKKMYNTDSQTYEQTYDRSQPSREITVDQLKGTIGRGEPIIATFTRIREDVTPGDIRNLRSHVIIIDDIQIINGEDHIICRNPVNGQGFAVSWKDFLEVWDGRACIPVGVRQTYNTGYPYGY